MEWYVVGLAILGLLVALIAIGLPIPFAMLASALPFLWTIQDWSTSLMSAEMMIWRAWLNYILLAIPLFVFLGELVARSTIGPNLYRVMHEAFPLRGAAAYGSVGACAGFGAVCGASLIGALTIGRVALPEMLRLGYGTRLATGVIAAGGTLSVLIPPSLLLIFYGIIGEVSIGKLFIAGVIPGLILSLFFVVVIVVWRYAAPGSVPPKNVVGSLSPVSLTLAVSPIVVIGGIIIGAIYFGVATPTEAAGVAAVVTLLLAITIGRLDRRGFVDALTGTVRTMGYLGILLAAALLFGFVLNYHRVPQNFSEMFLSLDLSPSMVLLVVIAFYLFVGMFLDPASMIFITLPTLMPLIENAGFDLVWFGILYVVIMEIAVLTPPVGINLYILQGLAPDVRIEDVIVGCLPFIVALCVLIVLLIAFPELALWLPGLM